LHAIRLDMNKATLERNFAVLLFVLVLVAFTFADRASKQLDRLYNPAPSAIQILKKQTPVAFQQDVQKMAQ
jgi:hypothetical protein